MKRNSKVLLISTLLLCGCNNAERNVKAEEPIVSAEEVTLSASEDSKSLIVSASPEQAEKNSTEISNALQQKKIIRSGNISIESQNIKKAKGNIDVLLDSFNGYYEDESTSSGAKYNNYTLKLRVPAQNFDNFIKKLESGNDKITEKSIQAQDISTQYYDIESRLKSKRTYLEQYQTMVKSAKTVTDLLEIQEQIRLLQEDIDSSESLLRNLSGQISYSTLTINLYDSNTSTYSDSFLNKIKDSLDTGWNLIANIFLGLITIWPIIIGVIIFIFGWKKYKKNKSKV